MRLHLLPAFLLPCMAFALGACGQAGEGWPVEPDDPAAGYQPGPALPPDDPGPADLTFEIDATRDARAISPFIYGTNQPDWTGKSRYLPFARSGGNRFTAFNWENNASNAGSDWSNQNDAYLGSSDMPGDSPRAWTEAAHSAGASLLMTVPMLGHVAADKSPEGDVNQTADYLQTRFHASVARKDGAFSFPPDTADRVVYQDEFVAWLESEFPHVRTDPSRTLFYSLDNEPDLWAGTHPRLHPEPATYDELSRKSTELASAIKDVAPEALVFGPASYGWHGFKTLQDAPDGGGRDFLDFYLQEMRRAESAHGRRLLDVLDIHWYPEATGGGVRITGQESSPEVAAARVQAPRSLWDPGYVESSWIADFSTLGPIRLLPWLQEKIDAHYPGTRLAVTEYNYGGGGHISGGVAQADVLGVFGREGVFAAALWELAEDQRFIHAGFDMFRSYDGNGGAFGDISVRAETPDSERTSVYASVDTSKPGRMVLVAINRSTEPLTAGFRIAAPDAYRRAEVYRLTESAPAPVRDADLAIERTNAFSLSLPAMSVSTIVLER